jgi:hypothetical protein
MFDELREQAAQEWNVHIKEYNYRIISADADVGDEPSTTVSFNARSPELPPGQLIPITIRVMSVPPTRIHTAEAQIIA